MKNIMDYGRGIAARAKGKATKGLVTAAAVAAMTACGGGDPTTNAQGSNGGSSSGGNTPTPVVPVVPPTPTVNVPTINTPIGINGGTIVFTANFANPTVSSDAVFNASVTKNADGSYTLSLEPKVAKSGTEIVVINDANGKPVQSVNEPIETTLQTPNKTVTYAVNVPGNNPITFSMSDLIALFGNVVNAKSVTVTNASITGGSVSQDPTTGTVTITPNLDYTGSMTISVNIVGLPFPYDAANTNIQTVTLTVSGLKTINSATTIVPIGAFQSSGANAIVVPNWNTGTISNPDGVRNNTWSVKNSSGVEMVGSPYASMGVNSLGQAVWFLAPDTYVITDSAQVYNKATKNWDPKTNTQTIIEYDTTPAPTPAPTPTCPPGTSLGLDGKTCF